MAEENSTMRIWSRRGFLKTVGGGLPTMKLMLEGTPVGGMTPKEGVPVRLLGQFVFRPGTQSRSTVKGLGVISHLET